MTASLTNSFKQKHFIKAFPNVPSQASKQMKVRIAEIRSCLDKLCQLFPQCFSLEKRKPLQRRIDKAIKASPQFYQVACSMVILRQTLAYYTRSPQYLETLIPL